MIASPPLRFVSDVGRPGVCGTVGCHHFETDHKVDGPCRLCGCQRYDPPRYFEDE